MVLYLPQIPLLLCHSLPPPIISTVLVSLPAASSQDLSQPSVVFFHVQSHASWDSGEIASKLRYRDIAQGEYTCSVALLRHTIYTTTFIARDVGPHNRQLNHTSFFKR